MNENKILYHDGSMEAECATMVRKVYYWMAAALVITGLVAFYVASSPMMMSYILTNRWLMWLIIFGEFGLVIGLSASIQKLSPGVATALFILYSILNGIMLSVIFLVYSLGSIATTFFVTAGTFALTAFYGSITKRDLSKFGNYLMMALIGLIIAAVVNIFLHNTVFDMVVSMIGVLVFVGLTIYDTQKIKQMFYGAVEDDITNSLAVLGALTLYLDFINIFLYLLRLLGNRK